MNKRWRSDGKDWENFTSKLSVEVTSVDEMCQILLDRLCLHSLAIDGAFEVLRSIKFTGGNLETHTTKAVNLAITAGLTVDIFMEVWLNSLKESRHHPQFHSYYVGDGNGLKEIEACRRVAKDYVGAEVLAMKPKLLNYLERNKFSIEVMLERLKQ